MNSEIKLPDAEPCLRMVPMPRDTNSAGNIFGGWIMAQVDIAGSIAAIRRAKGRVVTVAVSEFQFHHPVFVGDLVSFYAEVVKVGNTSLTTFVEVYAERGRDGSVQKVTQATVTYVALDEAGKPRQLSS